MPDFASMALGRLPKHPLEKSKRVSFASVFGTDLPAPPAARDWTEGATKRPMFGNDNVGDCTCAGIANIFVGDLKAAYCENWAPSTADVLALYSAVAGYDPSQTQPDGSNPTDRGAVIEDVLAYVMKHGFKGHHLVGTVAIEPANVENIKRSIDWFGVVDIGVDLPLAWQTQSIWDVAPNGVATGTYQPASWGGHCVVAEKYDERGLYVWSWGELILLTWGAVATYVDTIDAVIAASWIKAGRSPPGLSLAMLESRMSALRETA